jgi:hypothetical protein
MDQHSFSKLDPHSPKMLDPDPHKVNADPKHSFQIHGQNPKKLVSTVTFKKPLIGTGIVVPVPDFTFPTNL